MNENRVAIYRTAEAIYPDSAPFHPDQQWPEYEFGSVLGSQRNVVYEGVREALHLAGLDQERYGSPEWNPLGEFIRPGQVVLLKPNLICESHPRDPNGWVYTITNGSVIRAVADYVWKALKGSGRIIVADAPQTDSSFEAMSRQLGLDVLKSFYAETGKILELVDLRREQWTNRKEVIVDRRPLPGDPNGYVALDLGERSEFVGHPGENRYYGADYDTGEVNQHHREGRHEYLISGSAIKCDVFINLPKLKTHKKTGVTVNLKNLVGINGDKNWLPHHTVGTPRDGGDQYPDATVSRSVEHHSAATLRKLALAVPGVGPWVLQKARWIGKKIFGNTNAVVRSGNWYGNDTTWRMCLDLNKALLYGAPDGTLRSPALANRKPYLCFVDGVIAGHGNGPDDPDPLKAGVILFGVNPVSTDAVSAVLMGLNPDKLPIIHQAFVGRGFPLTAATFSAICCISNDERWSTPLPVLASSGEVFNFRPHFGWVGHIEAAR